jgi:hypothetical protein
MAETLPPADTGNNNCGDENDHSKDFKPCGHRYSPPNELFNVNLAMRNASKDVTFEDSATDKSVSKLARISHAQQWQKSEPLDTG